MPSPSRIALPVLKSKGTNIWLGVGAEAIARCEAELELGPAADNKANAIVVASLVVRGERRESSEQSAQRGWLVGRGSCEKGLSLVSLGSLCRESKRPQGRGLLYGPGAWALAAVCLLPLLRLPLPRCALTPLPRFYRNLIRERERVHRRCHTATLRGASAERIFCFTPRR
jgi:hypothetical protein